MRRRAFLAGGLASGALVACGPWTRATLPVAPTEHELATLAAIADTFLPGGSDGLPGAHEVNALATLVHPAHGLVAHVPAVVADLDDWVTVTHGLHTFVELTPARREQALEERMGLRGALIRSWYLPIYEGILALTKLAYFGATVGSLGASAIGFPGPSAGYAAASAAGAYVAREPAWPIARGASSVLAVQGVGAVRAARFAVFATTRERVRATLRISAPGGRSDEVALALAGGDGLVDDVALRVAGGPAAGAWRLEVVAHAGGAATLGPWALRLATDLDG